MAHFKSIDYAYEGLRGPPGPATSLAYLVGLVDSPDHGIADPLSAKRILGWLYEIEEQAPSAALLVERQNLFAARYFPGGYFPLTPCMLVTQWSPISAMLDRGLSPVVLRKEEKHRATATGIWEPHGIESAKEFDQCRTCEDLFWAILNEVCCRAKRKGMWVSVIAAPGWCYESGIGALPKWSAEEIAESGRIIWRRTPEG